MSLVPFSNISEADLDLETSKLNRSHGTGRWRPEDFASFGKNVIIEDEVLVFHPETISLGDNVYVGHRAILKGYHKNQMIVGDHSWIGQNCFLHSAGGIRIGSAVGIGPGVQIVTSTHKDDEPSRPILFHPLEFQEVVVEDGADIGVGSTLLPGVTIGAGAVIGAGSVVTRDIPAFAVAAGVPCKVLRSRDKSR